MRSGIVCAGSTSTVLAGLAELAAIRASVGTFFLLSGTLLTAAR
jgi:hypothetical protein